MADEKLPFAVSDRRSSHTTVDPETNNLDTSSITAATPPQTRRVRGYYPLEDRIIVKRFSEQEISAGGIIIPDVGKEKPAQGQVLSTGPGRYNVNTGDREPMPIKVGDYILFGKYAGTDVNINGEDLLIMRVEEIFCRLDFEALPLIPAENEETTT